MPEHMWKKKKIWIAPVGVFLLLSAVYLSCGLFPYGENTAAWGDMTQQVIPLLMELKEILLGTDSLAYTHLTAGGMNFFGVFLFFLSSPFSFLVVLIPNETMILWANVLVLLKLTLCGFCAQWFFAQKFSKLAPLDAGILGICYALCGYALLFYQNLVWLDFMALFPLLMLSLDTLLHTGRRLPFILALGGMLVVNLYLSYMLVLFLILFCGIYALCFLAKEERGGFALLLGTSAFLSALLTAPAWLPFLLQYMKSARGVDLLTSLSGGNFFSDIRTTFCVLLACPFMLAAMIFPVQTGQLKRKFLLGMFTLLTIPLLIDPINRMWHTGSYQAFPARYGFLAVFIGSMIAALTLSNQPGEIRRSRKSALVVCFGLAALLLGTICLIFILLAPYLDDYVRSLWVSNEQFASVMLVFVAGFLSVFAALFCWQNRWLARKSFRVVFCVSVAACCLFYSDVFIGQVSRSPESWQQAAELSEEITEDGYYRVKMEEKSFDINLLGGMGYNNLGHYTSLTTERYLYGMKKLGYSAYWMEVSPVGGTALTDALLCNRYIIEPLGLKESGNVIASNDRYQIRELPDSNLSLGIVTKGTLPAEIGSYNRAEIQELLYQSVFGREDRILTVYEPTGKQNVSFEETSGHYRLQPGLESVPSVLEWTVRVDGRQALYFDCFDTVSTELVEPVNSSFDIEVNRVEWESNYPSKARNGLLYLGTFQDETVTVRVTLLKEVEAKSLGLYGMDLNRLQTAQTEANQADIVVSGGTLSGLCEAEEGDRLFLSIPYDEGFTAKVNGKQVEIEQAFDCFMAIPLQSGENAIQITYQLPGLKAGLLLFAAGLVGTIWVVLRRKRRRRRPGLEKTAWAMLAAFTVLILLGVYLMPVLLWLYSHYMI